MFPRPVVPFARAADVAARTPWHTPPRRLLDDLLLSVQEGECLVALDARDRATPHS